MCDGRGHSGDLPRCRDQNRLQAYQLWISMWPIVDIAYFYSVLDLKHIGISDRGAFPFCGWHKINRTRDWARALHDGGVTNLDMIYGRFCFVFTFWGCFRFLTFVDIVRYVFVF